MFYSENRDLYLKDRHPTDVQAEVLVKGNILPKYIQNDCSWLWTMNSNIMKKNILTIFWDLQKEHKTV